jgi:hypothetical protein
MSRLTAIQIDGIVRRHRPRGWRVHQRPPTATLWGQTDPHRRRIDCPPLDTRDGIFIFFHEVGHVRYRHDFYEAAHKGHARPHVEEYEAERYAIAAMQNEKIPVPRGQLKRAKENVRDWIEKDRQKKFDIDPKIERWSRA